MAKKLTSTKARKILHDKEVHGQPLTDKQRRFFGAIAGGAKPYKAESGGWLDKYVPKAQNGIEGTMGGLTDIGFNYNGAWGGPSMQTGGNIQPAMAGANQTVPMAQLGDSVKPITMQLAMGGSIPGAVGFTYARTVGAAPSNGPYAKKTKASAQNGMEMKYYQQGLDFKPKTISKNGSWLNKYDKAQDGENLPIWAREIPRSTGDIQSYISKVYPKKTKKEAEKEALETTARNAIANQPVIRQATTPIDTEKTKKKNKQYAQSTGRKYNENTGAVEERFTPNEERVMNRVVENIIEPMLVLEGAMAAAPLVKKGLQAAGKYATENTALRNAYKLNPTTGTLPPAQKAGFPNPLAIADEIIPMPPAPQNILGAQGGWMELSPLNFLPGYGSKLSAKSAYPNLVGFRKFGNSLEDVIQRQALSPKGGSPLRIGRSQIVNEGNWAAVGAPDENYKGVFEATMNPQIEGSNILLQRISNRYGILGTTKGGSVDIPLSDPGLSFNRRLPFSARYVPIDKQKLMNNEFQLATMAPRLQSLVEKYGVGLGLASLFGKRDLYDKYTIDPIKNWTKEKWENYKKYNIYKEGGEIPVDPDGYWNPENWGNPVIIPSTDITMEGVDQPLIGISDTGDVQYMEPGEDYEFEGEYVTEYPVAKKGISVNMADQNPNQKLDQLLNFTNYNKPTKGGWLDKYN